MKMQGSAQQLKKQSGHILQHPAPRQRPKSNRLSRPHRKPRLHLILLQHKALGKEVLLLKAQLWHLPIGAFNIKRAKVPGQGAGAAEPVQSSLADLRTCAAYTFAASGFVFRVSLVWLCVSRSQDAQQAWTR